MLWLFALSAVLGLSLVALADYLQKRKHIKNETARKMVHFAHAFVVAGWPVFFGYWFVIIGEILFLGVVLAAQEYKIFHGLRKVPRKTWGEFFLPLGLIWLALLAPPYWVFISAVMLLGLADGMAAIVGTRIKSKQYKFIGIKKSVAGTLAFFMVAVLVMSVILRFSNVSISANERLLTVIVLPLILTIIENISPYGSDNLTIPLAVYVGLSYIGIFV
jgi:phytol kinase